MEHRDVFILETIVEFCDKIAAVLFDEQATQESFIKDDRLQDLCAFYVLQVGENARELSGTFINSHPEIEWHKIIGLRNLIAHEYGGIDSEYLWQILQKNIPEFKAFCVGIIK